MYIHQNQLLFNTVYRETFASVMFFAPLAPLTRFRCQHANLIKTVQILMTHIICTQLYLGEFKNG